MIKSYKDLPLDIFFWIRYLKGKKIILNHKFEGFINFKSPVYDKLNSNEYIKKNGSSFECYKQKNLYVPFLIKVNKMHPYFPEEYSEFEINSYINYESSFMFYNFKNIKLFTSEAKLKIDFLYKILNNFLCNDLIEYILKFLCQSDLLEFKLLSN